VGEQFLRGNDREEHKRRQHLADDAILRDPARPAAQQASVIRCKCKDTQHTLFTHYVPHYIYALSNHLLEMDGSSNHRVLLWVIGS
jgi:hypothetical protein